MKQEIKTILAPAAIGSYSQAIKSEKIVYLSGQIPLNQNTMIIVDGGIKPQIIQVFKNLKAVAESSGAGLNSILKLTVYLTDILHLEYINEIMPDFFDEPYPARTSIVVTALPKAAMIEVDAILTL
ncbi:Rid family detoxifying hydrolase [Gammaproteobacteria bacterium]|nr:Rid family detoxifying hydrolase [Gammaproteobacteria bacterium]